MDGQSIAAVQTETNDADFFVAGRHFRNGKSYEEATAGADPRSVFSHDRRPFAASLFLTSRDVKVRPGYSWRLQPWTRRRQLHRSVSSRTLRHTVPLALEFVTLVYHGVFDRCRDLRVGFFEARCAWILLLKDRMDRDESIYTTSTGKQRSLTITFRAVKSLSAARQPADPALCDSAGGLPMFFLRVGLSS